MSFPNQVLKKLILQYIFNGQILKHFICIIAYFLSYLLIPVENYLALPNVPTDLGV